MRLYDEWLRRSTGIVAGVRVGSPGELWRVVPKNPANDWVLAKAAELGRDYDESNVAYYTSRSLLRDVLHAAGAIEYTVHRIEAAAAALARLRRAARSDSRLEGRADEPLGPRRR